MKLSFHRNLLAITIVSVFSVIALLTSNSFITGAATSINSTSATKALGQMIARDSQITVQAKGIGQPWINLSDGHTLPLSYYHPLQLDTAELQQALANHQATPL